MRFLGENTFYVYQIFIYSIYGYAILSIGSYVFKFDDMGTKYLYYFVLLTLLYPGLLNHFLSKIPLLEHFAYLFEPDGLLIIGVAGQYILGPIFQPSVFGIFILLSIYVFLRDKPFIAVVCLAIAIMFHSTYLLVGAILTCIYMAVIANKDKDYWKTLLLGMSSLFLAMQILLYTYFNFSPTTINTFSQAQDILVDYRIPHHVVVVNWFDRTVSIQIIVISLALYVTKHTKLYPILKWLLLTTIVLTVTHAFTGNKSLALLFPWRISVVLVPIASSILLASIISGTFQLFKQLSSKDWFMKRRTRYLLLVSGIAIVVLSLLFNFIGVGIHLFLGAEQVFGIIGGTILIAVSLIIPHKHEIARVLQQIRVVRLLQVAILVTIIMLGHSGVRHTAILFNEPRVGITASSKFVASTYQPGNLYLIPPDIESFRLAAKVPIS